MASFSDHSSIGKCPTTTTNKPKHITSAGPAGTKFSVREAGENILNNFCHGYPGTDVSSIIPNLFSGNITELMEPRSDLTQKEVDKFCGWRINQEGEKHEKMVFDMFNRLIRQPDTLPTLLILRTFEMDTKNAVGLKRRALMTELPGLNLKSAITTAENDFIALVKDCGVVFVEVKGSTTENNVISAEKQLKNVNCIAQSVMKAMTGDSQRTIPTVKLILVPDCTDPSPREKTKQGSYFLFKDSCENFRNRFKEIVNELQQLNSSNSFTSDNFKQFSEILVGIWSAKAVSVMDKNERKYHLELDDSEVALVEQLKDTDKIVDTASVRNERLFKLKEEKMSPLTNIICTTEEDIIR